MNYWLQKHKQEVPSLHFTLVGETFLDKYESLYEMMKSFDDSWVVSDLTVGTGIAVFLNAGCTGEHSQDCIPFGRFRCKWNAAMPVSVIAFNLNCGFRMKFRVENIYESL